MDLGNFFNFHVFRDASNGKEHGRQRRATSQALSKAQGTEHEEASFLALSWKSVMFTPAMDGTQVYMHSALLFVSGVVHD